VTQIFLGYVAQLLQVGRSPRPPGLTHCLPPQDSSSSGSALARASEPSRRGRCSQAYSSDPSKWKHKDAAVFLISSLVCYRGPWNTASAGQSLASPWRCARGAQYLLRAGASPPSGTGGEVKDGDPGHHLHQRDDRHCGRLPFHRSPGPTGKAFKSAGVRKQGLHLYPPARAHQSTDSNSDLVLKADAIKFVLTFRAQVAAAGVGPAMPHLPALPLPHPMLPKACACSSAPPHFVGGRSSLCAAAKRSARGHPSLPSQPSHEPLQRGVLIRCE
jgi:hypothetical protein